MKEHVEPGDQTEVVAPQCPASHRAARKISTAIILLLLVAIIALGAVAFFNR